MQTNILDLSVSCASRITQSWRISGFKVRLERPDAVWLEHIGRQQVQQPLIARIPLRQVDGDVSANAAGLVLYPSGATCPTTGASGASSPGAIAARFVVTFA